MVFKRTVYILFYLFSLMMLNACNNDSAIEGSIVEPQFQPEETNIGYLMGSVVHLRNTALLAMSEINQNGGVLGGRFNMVILQSENPETSKVKSVELMDDYGVELIVVTTSSRTLAVVEEAAPREVVVLSETATSPLLTLADDNDFLFRTVPSDVYQGRMLADLAWQHEARTAVMVVNSDDPYGSGLAAEFNLVFQNHGGHSTKVVAIPESTRTGFGDYIDEVYQDSPDTVILSLLSGPANAQFVNESVASGFDGFYLLPDTAVGSDFTNNLASSELMENAYGVSPSFGVEANPEFVHFKDAYLAQYNIPHQRFDTNVYDAVMVTALAIEHAGNLNNTTTPTGAMIKDSMRAVMNPPGEKLGPSQIGRALQLLREGKAVDYSGAYSSVDFDSHGDLAGSLVYDIYHYDPQSGQLVIQQQLFVEVPSTQNE